MVYLDIDHADLAFNDRRDRCTSLLARAMKKGRVPEGARDWLKSMIQAIEIGVRPRARLAPVGWRHQSWRERRARRPADIDEAKRSALDDVIEIARRASGEAACPPAAAAVIESWTAEVHRRFKVEVSASRISDRILRQAQDEGSTPSPHPEPVEGWGNARTSL